MKFLEEYISIDNNKNGVTGLTDGLFCYYLYRKLVENKKNILLVND